MPTTRIVSSDRRGRSLTPRLSQQTALNRATVAVTAVHGDSKTASYHCRTINYYDFEFNQVDISGSLSLLLRYRTAAIVRAAESDQIGFKFSQSDPPPGGPGARPAAGAAYGQRSWADGNLLATFTHWQVASQSPISNSDQLEMTLMRPTLTAHCQIDWIPS